MRPAFKAVVSKHEQNAGRVPDLAERGEWLRRIREESVGDKGLARRAVANLEANGFAVRWAGNSSEAVGAVLEKMGDARSSDFSLCVPASILTKERA